jgi:membrane peptidoglycan carboxypeptidase
VIRISGLEAGERRIDKVSSTRPSSPRSSAPAGKRRQVPLSAIPARMVQAVLAIEDRRFYDHPGVDVIRTIGAIVTNLRARRSIWSAAARSRSSSSRTSS